MHYDFKHKKSGTLTFSATVSTEEMTCEQMLEELLKISFEIANKKWYQSKRADIKNMKYWWAAITLLGEQGKTDK